MKNRIKVIRAEQNLSQEALAKNAGISRTTLVSIEKGTANPDGHTIAKLVKALKKPANEIFFDLDVMQA
jgi:putative transcriptional regulator